MEKIKTPLLLYFADYIEKETGIIYGEENAYQLENRLLEICRTLELGKLEDLFEKAKSGGIHGMTKQFLLDLSTNNETSFFRDPKVFKAFEKYMVPEAMKLPGAAGGLKVWSVASSFGQEPYSLSMLIQQLIESGIPLRGTEILTTDISHRALERVKKAIYSHLEVQRGLPANLMIKYFDKLEDDTWKIKHEISSRVSAQHLNLLNIFGVKGPYHVIFCRNVLIYQNEEKKKKIINELAKNIVPGGFFVMGAAESLFGLSDEFEQVKEEGAVFYRRLVK